MIEVDRVQLREQHVKEPPALPGSPLDDQQILRGEQDAAQMPEQFADALCLPFPDFDVFLLFLSPGKDDRHLMRSVPVRRPDRHPAKGLLPPDHLLIPAGPVASPHAAQMKRLNDIGLPLCVASDEHIHSRAGCDLHAFIVSEILQNQGIHFHSATKPRLTQDTRTGRIR